MAGFFDNLITTSSEARARQEAQQAELAQALAGTPGPFASGAFPQPGLSPQADPATQQRTLQALMAAGGSPAQAVQTSAMQQPAGDQGLQVGQISPKDFTVESIGRAQQTGNIADLERFIDPLELQRANISADRLDLQVMLASRPSDSQLQKFIATQQQLDSLDSAFELIDPNFFGFGFDSVGEAVRQYRRRFGDAEAVRFNNFWREYEMWVQQMRKENYGTQFTPTEERNFERLVVKPSDGYPAAVAGIQQQRSIVARSGRRQRSILEELGFNLPQRRPLTEIDVSNDTGAPVEVFRSGAR